MFEVFRSKEYINAVYFDGSLETAMEICKSFPSRVSLEFIDSKEFLLRVSNQAAFIQAHTWVYRNGSDRLEWRDTEELGKKWDKWTGSPLTEPKAGGKPSARRKRAK